MLPDPLLLIAIARYRDRKDTCCLAALSLNLRRKRHPIIWSAKCLPSDSYCVMAVPKGGVLVLSQSLIMYYTQVQAGRGGQGLQPHHQAGC